MGKTVAIDCSLPDFVAVVGGESYHLRYDFGAFRAYEKATGVNPLTPEFEINATNLDRFLWAGFQRQHPQLTVEQIQEWLIPSNMRGFLNLAADAYYACIPRPEEQKEASMDPQSA